MASADCETIKMQTLAFFDLETTGLLKYAAPLPRITEIAIVAIPRDEFLDSVGQVLKNSQFTAIRNSETLDPQANGDGPIVDRPLQPFVVPRILSKLVQPINPEIDIHCFASQISGLHAKNLSSMPTFPAFTPVLMAYLESLPKPICLIAHNGKRFDFPILRGELSRSGIDIAQGHDGVFWADSMNLFQNIDNRWVNERVLEMTEDQTNAPVIEQVEIAEEITVQQTGQESPLSASQKAYRFRFVAVSGTPGTEYETSPTQSTQQESSASENGLATSIQRQLFLNDSPAKRKFLEFHESQAQCQSQSSQTQGTKVKVSYSLKNVHNRIFDGLDPDKHHSAEGDCLSILKVAAQYGEDFLSELDKMARPMWKNGKPEGNGA